ncbi:carbon catabolite repressor protein 4 homolog 3 isoform X2 [Diospyros lotus]|uniref:carbon catabolite repressor protein 4 homolog 3 isoform X2 n=1 Tax=Diospyros lotus TaxID=55363 RepID=UPI00225A1DA6|nr:carbon catabolite repressor protein 4 homolog 3 isoform X2 [Diospyros lotus]
MGCRDTSSWRCATTGTATTSLKLQYPFFFFRSTISFCTNTTPTHSTSFSASSSRRWYNPARRLRFHRPPPEIVRHWVEADPPLPYHQSQETFMVVSYNILGDRNASKHRDLYTYVPSIYMKWDRRRRIICRELLGLDPDIICLQEVDKYFDLLNVMENAGYSGSYKKRTGDAVDGCAMFWKADKFRLLECETIEFKGYNLRDNVAQLSVFEMSEAESRRFVVGNIHVLYNPSRGDVKLGQIRSFSSKAHILSEKWGSVPVVLAGDYNSTPQLHIMSHDRKGLSGQRSCHPANIFGIKREKEDLLFSFDRFFKSCWSDKEVKVATGDAGSPVVEHPLKLSSSYAKVKGYARTRDFNGEPLATSYHSKFIGTVDYLWHSDGLVPTRVLDTLPLDVLQKIGGLPCKELGSDHLALVSEFAFTCNEETADSTGEGALVSQDSLL